MEDNVWTQEMSLGIPPIDDAHQALVEQIVRLQAAPDDSFDAGLLALTACLEADFRAEEEMMEAIDYPAIRSHREQHARVLGTLHGLAAQALDARRRAVDLLLPWFHLHLETADTALAAALQVGGVQFDTGPQASTP